MQSAGGTDGKGCGRRTETDRSGFRKKKNVAKTWLRPTEADIGGDTGACERQSEGRAMTWLAEQVQESLSTASPQGQRNGRVTLNNL